MPMHRYRYLRGFVRMTINTWKQQVHPDVNASDLEIIMTGHSLGGALATLAAADVGRANAKMRVSLASFGCPQVGCKKFVKLVKARTANRIARFWDVQDPVVVACKFANWAGQGLNRTHRWPQEDGEAVQYANHPGGDDGDGIVVSGHRGYLSNAVEMAADAGAAYLEGNVGDALLALTIKKHSGHSYWVQLNALLDGKHGIEDVKKVARFAMAVVNNEKVQAYASRFLIRTAKEVEVYDANSLGLAEKVPWSRTPGTTCFHLLSDGKNEQRQVVPMATTTTTTVSGNDTLSGEMTRASTVASATNLVTSIVSLGALAWMIKMLYGRDRELKRCND